MGTMAPRVVDPAALGLNLEDIMPSEISLSPKDKHCGIHSREMRRGDGITETENGGTGWRGVRVPWRRVPVLPRE